jgi:H+/Cl- antiporter ClcA
MVSKDQAIGGVIFLVCVLVALFYVITLFYPQWLVNMVGLNVDTTWMPNVQFWLVAIPVFLAFILVLGIGAWIGWTMATTPPPKPIEELELEEETSESKEEKKKEETGKKK